MDSSKNKVLLIVPQAVIDKCLSEMNTEVGDVEVVGLVSEFPNGSDILVQKSEPRKADDSNLSDREKEILVCVAQGMLNKEIADKFNLSIYTVVTHRKNITKKTGIKTVAGLTVYALLNGLIDINSIDQ